ncbi:MAG: hypothetical protein I8H94_00150 [Rhodobacteraceae bacterium]|nr:hypothetical protein [Paracoccaceae bacterium]
MSAAPPSIPELEARLAQLGRSGQTITYGALARDLAIPGPGAIAKLTDALEHLMQADAAANRPLRAALCAGRLANGLPGQGFFLLAQQLGCFDGTDPGGFITAERGKLWAAATQT